MEMKLFKITPKRCWYDEYEAITVVAEDKDSVTNMIHTDEEGTRFVRLHNKNYKYNETVSGNLVKDYEARFWADQGELSIQEISLNEECVVSIEYMNA